jgi:hypothetical protein
MARVLTYLYLVWTAGSWPLPNWHSLRKYLWHKSYGPMGPHGAPCYVPIKAEIGWVSVCSPQDKSPSTARRLFRRSSSECEKWRPIITSYGFLWFHIWIYYMDIYIWIWIWLVNSKDDKQSSRSHSNIKHTPEASRNHGGMLRGWDQWFV